MKDDLSPTPAAYQAAVRRLRAEPPSGLRPLRVAVAASFRAEPLGNYLVVEGAHRGFDLQLSFCPYGQWELQCATPDSELYAGKPEVVVIAVRLEDADIARIEQAVAAVRRLSGASVVVFNFTEPLHGASREAVEEANRRIAAMDNPGVAVFDFARLALETGLRQLYDPRLDYISRMPFTVAAQIAIARGVARTLRAIHVPAAKCLVMDLDNTLWGGILGEVGPGGIALGQDYPGRAFGDFQRAARVLRDRGILLALASKNNVTEVRQVFDQHPDMVLRWDDFAAAEIHWNEKASSLRAIAGRLGIGVDALVFYDDNPLERSWIRSQLPEVTVIEVPDDPMQRIGALEACEAFDQVRVSAEDLQRAQLYAVEQQREQARIQSSSLDDFLATLEIRVTVGLVDAATLPRVAQLLRKTNQFNLTGRRCTDAELQSQLDRGAIACWLRASDRFGDYGLVAAAVALPDGRIDNFVVSCRILGRQVESALLAVLAEHVHEAGAERLAGEYIETPRNAPARDFYRDHGFEERDRQWVWEFSRGALRVPDHLTVGVEQTVGSRP